MASDATEYDLIQYLDQKRKELCQIVGVGHATVIDTIRSQLVKQELNSTILREAGQSIRNLVEGAIGGSLSPPIVRGITVLAAAVGLCSLETPLRDEGKVGLDVGGDGPDVLV